MQNKPDNQVCAGFFVRLAAYLLDSLIVGAALLFVRIPVAISSWIIPNNIIVKNFIFEYSIADIVIYLLGVTYFILMTYFKGATLGKKALHLRVVSAEDRKVKLFEIIYRETVGRFLSGLVLGVGYLMIGIHKKKLGLHDMLSDTQVVYYHENANETRQPEVTEYTAAEYMPKEEVEESIEEQENVVTDITTDYMPDNYMWNEHEAEEEID